MVRETEGVVKEMIREEALRIGFSHCGFARNETLEELRSFYTSFIRRPENAGLKYLETYLEKRLHPELVVEGTKSVIAVLMNYFPPEIIPEQDNFIISKYAYGADYHVIIRHRLQALLHFMQLTCSNHHAKAFVDSGAVLEKAWAQKCGIGWQGKNTLIINKSDGSFFFIGIIFTNLEFEPDAPETDHCGSCSNCVTACPTGALETPYQLNIPRCISYITIESKEEIPGDLKSKTGDRIYGCDICQDVCPFNRFASPHSVPGFLPAGSLLQMRKNEWLALTEPDFNRIFADSPVKRLGYQRLKRNLTKPNPKS